MSHTSTRLTRIAAGMLAAGSLALGLGMGTAPAYAADGSIDHVQEKDGALQILYSVPGGATPDLGTATVSFNGETLEATAEPASAGQVARTTVLAVDVSNSMKGDRFEAAKQAAHTFLEMAPDDLRVGLVTFAGEVIPVVAPTTNHQKVGKAIDELSLSLGTRLYDGVRQAVAATGKNGSRSVLVLSDGADSTDTEISVATDGIASAANGANTVKVDVIAIAQKPKAREKLSTIAAAGRGNVLDADEPAQIEALFADEAAALAQQVLITATPTNAMRGAEGDLAVSLTAGDEEYSGSTYVAIDATPAAKTSAPVTLERSEAGGLMVSKSMMWVGLIAAAVAACFLGITAAGGLGGPKQDTVGASIEAYTRQGARKLAAAGNGDGQPAAPSFSQQAVSAAQNLLQNNKGFEAKLGTRLEAAGMHLKPAEWLLMHAGIAIGFGLVGLLLSSGNVIFMLAALLVGIIGPWVYLGFKRKRRVKAFGEQLPDTLQLMAGSLSAGLSLAQSVDTVVREGTEPIAAEFRRAMIETRLGVEIEDALSGIADRMGSKDFEWIVMAIRIQRDVGGNLAELLNKVAETIREREYLHRQVLTLSAEGRLSVWVLGGLPPAFMAYLLMANPTYIAPMFSHPLGIAMLIAMAILETGGVLWMKQLVKVDV